MRTLSTTDKQVFNQALERALRATGLRENPFGPEFDFFSLLNGSTVEPQTINVSTSGNDSTGDGSTQNPFATITGALNSIPGKRIRYNTTIQVGIGSFPGFAVNGVSIEPADITNGASLSINGTLITATVATGSATGAVTSFAQGVFNPVSFAVITDTSQSWTVNDLRGKMVEILTGPAAGLIYPISSNTATTLTLTAVNITSPVATNTYAIRDWGTSITGSVTQAAGIIPGGTVTSATNVIILGNNAPSNAQQLAIQNMKISSGTTRATLIENNQANISFSGCLITSTTGNSVGMFGATSTLTLNRSVVVATSSNSMLVGGTTRPTPSALSLANVLMLGSGASNTFVRPSFYSFVRSAALHIIGVGTGTGIFFDSTSTFNNAGGLIIENVATGISIIDSTTVGMGSCMNLNASIGALIKNCTTAVSISGPSSMYSPGTMKIDTCTNGWVASRGARIQINSASTVTAVTNEITVDGTISSLASMRAASPKVANNANYFTAVYE